MKHNIELLKADIQEELNKLQRLESEFIALEPMLDRAVEEMPAYDRGAIGYYLHNFYNGCETIFRSVSRFVENDLGNTSWHSDLLKRMKLEIPGYRPAMINEELFTLLYDLKGFRHKFRHSYTFELDWEKERVVAKNLKKTARLLYDQVQQFIAALSILADDQSSGTADS